MRKIKRLSEEWIKSFCAWYNQVQSILIEAFIEYYGEMARYYQTKKSCYNRVRLRKIEN